MEKNDRVFVLIIIYTPVYVHVHVYTTLKLLINLHISDNYIVVWKHCTFEIFYWYKNLEAKSLFPWYLVFTLRALRTDLTMEARELWITIWLPMTTWWASTWNLSSPRIYKEQNKVHYIYSFHKKYWQFTFWKFSNFNKNV